LVSPAVVAGPLLGAFELFPLLPQAANIKASTVMTALTRMPLRPTIPPSALVIRVFEKCDRRHILDRNGAT
jgi:hypothetical protein